MRRSPLAHPAAILAGLALPVAAAVAGELDAAIGRALFNRAWVPAPSSTRANDGLGPLFNARACVSCHRDLDRAPAASAPDGRVVDDDLVLRLSDAAGRPDPTYGRQLQTAAVGALAPEGAVARDASARHRPSDLAYGPLGPRTRIGARLAPPLRGLGRLAAVPDEALAALADPDDRDGDGVRGRVNPIGTSEGGPRIGRFGLKADAASLEAQVETAFALDLGMSTENGRAPAGDCTPVQSPCLAGPHGGDGERPEIPPEIVRRVALFLASVPAPQPATDADGRRGERLFARIGCAACHAPELPSPRGPVRAFTDLLLHDLGPDLDGGATEPGVLPTEWRTAPLWGLSRTLERRAGLLHDGRAATVAEAVRLHGGEAAGSRARFDALPAADRRRLLAFVGSL